MYSVFNNAISTPNQRAIANDGSLPARKPGTVSARKPFAERKLNLKHTQTSNVDLKPVPKISVPMAKSPKKDQFFDEYIDVCSYKDVADDYSDIYKSGLLFHKNEINNTNLFLQGCIPKTPPLNDTFLEPLDEIRLDFDLPDYNLNGSDFELIQEDDVPIPTLEFN